MRNFFVAVVLGSSMACTAAHADEACMPVAPQHGYYSPDAIYPTRFPFPRLPVYPSTFPMPSMTPAMNFPVSVAEDKLHHMHLAARHLEAAGFAQEANEIRKQAERYQAESLIEHKQRQVETLQQEIAELRSQLSTDTTAGALNWFPSIDKLIKPTQHCTAGACDVPESCENTIVTDLDTLDDTTAEEAAEDDAAEEAPSKRKAFSFIISTER